MKRMITIVIAFVLLLASFTSCSSQELSSNTSSNNPDFIKYEEKLNNLVLNKTGLKFTASDIIIGDSATAQSLGVDMSEFNDDGYLIKTQKNNSVILGKTEKALDSAIYYFSKNCVDNNASVIPEQSYAYSEGPKIKNFTLAGADISNYIIKIPAGAPECLKFAASQLSSYIKKSCGIKIKTTTSSKPQSSNIIEFIIDPTATGGGLYDAGELGPDGYKITVSDGKMTIVGGNMRGHMYGVYDFLEKYVGWRFLGTTDYLYKSDSIAIDNVNYTDIPAFSYRATTYIGNNFDTYNFTNLRDNSGDGWTTSTINREQTGYGIGTMWYHAHSFEYQVEGLGQRDQPCFTDEKIRDEIVASMLSLLHERVDNIGLKIGYGATYISCSMNDSTNWCRCKTCRDETKAEGSIAGPYLKLVNYAADKVTEKYPGMKVYTIVYNGMPTPKTVRPNKNVVVHYCLQGCNNHTVAGGECANHPKTTLGGTNVREKENLEWWVRESETIYVWYYASCFYAYMAPSPIMDNLLEDMKYFKSLGVDGVYVEASLDVDYNFEYLQKYMVYKLMWNPDITEEEYWRMVDEFLEINYGDGWQYLREYIDMNEEASEQVGCWTNNYSLPFDMVSRVYYEANYEHMRTLFEKALALCNSAEQEEKIIKAQCGVDLLGLSATYNSVYKNGTAEEKKIYAERYKNLVDTCRKYELRVGDYDETKCPDNYDLNNSPIFNFYDNEGAKEKGR